jgi:hypothetical protein
MIRERVLFCHTHKPPAFYGFHDEPRWALSHLSCKVMHIWDDGEGIYQARLRRYGIWMAHISEGLAGWQLAGVKDLACFAYKYQLHYVSCILYLACYHP